MDRCGEYTLEKTIGWGRSTTYYHGFAREKGDNRVVICRTRATDRQSVLASLRSAAEQQTAISSGCRRIAPILDFGVSPTGHGYKVTVNYLYSLSDMIEAGGTIDSDLLKVIVSGILGALVELRDRCHRPHGNLTAGNVLFDSGGGVTLTDLAPTAKDLTHAADLNALGTIIYQLVRRSLSIGFLAPPLEDSQEWADALGENADDWREFTNRMLMAKRGEGRKLLTVAVKDLKGLSRLGENSTSVPVPSEVKTSGGSPSSIQKTRRSKTKKRRGLWASLSILALGGLGYGGWRHFTYKPPEPVVVQTVDPKDAAMKAFKGSIAKINKSSLGDGTYILARLGAAANLYDVETQLRGWSTTTALRKLAEEWRKPPRSWDGLAELLATKAQLEEPGEDETEAEQLERLGSAIADMERAAKLLSQGQSLDAKWLRVVQMCQRVLDTKVPGLPDFTGWAAEEIGKNIDLDSALQRLNYADSTLTELGKFAFDHRDRISPADFKKNTASIQELRTAPDWPRKWQDAILASLRPAPDILKGWEDQFTALSGRIAKRPPGEQKDLKAKLDGMRAKAATALTSDEASLTAEIRQMLDSIRNPVVDLDAALRKLITDFAKELANPQATTAQGIASFTRFKTDLASLLDSAEFRDSAPTVLSYYGLSRQNFLAKDGRYDSASKAPPEPKFLFRKDPEKWLPGKITKNSGSFTYAPNSTIRIPVNFFIPGTEKFAVAGSETSVALARLSGPPLDPPRINVGGFLSARDTPLSQMPVWVWPQLEQWIKAVTAAEAEGVSLSGLVRSELGAAINRATDLISADYRLEQLPLTWVSAASAVRTASALGCRLPSSTEWTTMLSTFGPGQSSARLRGDRLSIAERAIALFNTNQPGSRPYPKPSLILGSYMFLDGAPGSNYTGRVNDQGAIWLTPALMNANTVTDLIGNASEWLADSDSGPFYIAGGSCLTPASAGMRTPVRVNAGPADTYCDVSFRLVVDVTPGSEDAPLIALRKEAQADAALIASKEPIPQ